MQPQNIPSVQGNESAAFLSLIDGQAKRREERRPASSRQSRVDNLRQKRRYGQARQGHGTSTGRTGRLFEEGIVFRQLRVSLRRLWLNPNGIPWGALAIAYFLSLFIRKRSTGFIRKRTAGALFDRYNIFDKVQLAAPANASKSARSSARRSGPRPAEGRNHSSAPSFRLR
jgi:hypothetical protein